MRPKVYHWTDLDSLPTLFPPVDARMLHEDGCLRKQYVRVKGTIRGTCKASRFIRYDREYVLTNIRAIFVPLAIGGVSKQDILGLVSEALDYLPPQD